MTNNGGISRRTGSTFILLGQVVPRKLLAIILSYSSVQNVLLHYARC
nr:MAG TPA: hypothetical protein [Caudoviricetes sp.]